MRHAGTQKRPAQRLMLFGHELAALLLGHSAARAASQVLQIEFRLLLLFGPRLAGTSYFLERTLQSRLALNGLR